MTGVLFVQVVLIAAIVALLLRLVDLRQGATIVAVLVLVLLLYLSVTGVLFR